jgi:hypothetical protein
MRRRVARECPCWPVRIEGQSLRTDFVRSGIIEIPLQRKKEKRKRRAGFHYLEKLPVTLQVPEDTVTLALCWLG